VLPDRLVLLYGGQYGDTLYRDIWQYNLNTNMWAVLSVTDLQNYTVKNCTSCTNCDHCGSLVFSRVNCENCVNCTSSQGPDVFNGLTCDYCDNCMNASFF